MQFSRKIRAFISFVCALSLILPIFAVPAVAADGKTVTATTSASVKQGGSDTLYVYIDSTESLASLDVTVHFDPEKIKVNTVTNSLSAILYDNAKNTDSVQFSYILDGKGSISQARLFYFTYQVLPTAEPGDTYFDITIGEAYDKDLNDVPVFGSRTKLTIAETVATKTCTVSAESSVNTSVEKEFSLSYQFSTYEIVSGSAVIQYDPELFEVVSLANGAFLENKSADVNAELPGSIYFSFAGTEYNTKYDLATVTFKTIKNTEGASDITFKATELCDKDRDLISCKDCVTTVNVSFDDTYAGDAPEMSVSAAYDSETKKVTAKILLDEESNLGAGDFVLSFDPEKLTLISYEKGFAPNFFIINDKETAKGKLKFSIISLKDITAAQTVLTVVFEPRSTCIEQVDFKLGGSMISDSLTNPILLRFKNDRVALPVVHDYSVRDKNAEIHWMKCSVCGIIDETSYSDHVYDSGIDKDCNVCGETREVPKLTLTLSAEKLIQEEEFTVTVTLDKTVCTRGFGFDWTQAYDHSLFEWVDGAWDETIEDRAMYSAVQPGAYTAFVSEKDLEVSGEIFTFVLKPIGVVDCSKTYEIGITPSHLLEAETLGATLTMEHTFDHACDTECNYCDYTRTITHDYSVQDKSESEHWMKCSVCGEIDETTREAHGYDNACDTTCDECGHIRTITHTYDNACDPDCNVCGADREVPDHVYDDDRDATCNECGAERIVFIYGDVNNDGRVNLLDSTILERYLAKWPDYTEDTLNLQAADVNNDGRVNLLDSTILARHLAKWPDYAELPYAN